MLEKLNWVRLTSLVALKFGNQWVSRKNQILRCKVVGALIRSMKFFFLRLLCISINKACGFEYCCHVWAGAPSSYLKLSNKLQKRICRTVGPSLTASLESLAHRRNIASLSLLVDIHLNWLTWFHFRNLVVYLIF